jgi:hypothetical protein
MAKNVFRSPERQVYRPKRRVKLWAVGLNLDMSTLLKNLPFFIFLAFLGLLYIANSHHAIKTIREINSLQEELKRKSWESNARLSELMYNSMQSEIAKRTKNLNLEELTDRPYKLVMKK